MLWNCNQIGKTFDVARTCIPLTFCLNRPEEQINWPKFNKMFQGNHLKWRQESERVRETLRQRLETVYNKKTGGDWLLIKQQKQDNTQCKTKTKYSFCYIQKTSPLQSLMIYFQDTIQKQERITQSVCSNCSAEWQNVTRFLERSNISKL